MIGFSAIRPDRGGFPAKPDVPLQTRRSEYRSPLIRSVAASGKPLLISTGMATVSELDETVRCARRKDLILLKCQHLPCLAGSNLLTIRIRALFDCEVGLSDHTMGVGAAVASIALGASVIEKHFTLDRSDGGVDSTFSLEPQEFSSLVTETERAWQACGVVSYGPTPKEQASLAYRRSLYIVEDMKKGQAFTGRNLRAIRPGLGLPPKYYDALLGKTINRDAAKEPR